MFGWRKVVSSGRGVVEPPTRLITPGLRGFKQFLMRGNIVDLAIAVVVGTAFTAVVQSLVKNIFTPLIAAIGGEPDFSSLTFTINDSKFRYGAFINDVIAFIVVAAVIYFVIVLPLAKANEMRRRGEEPEPQEEPAISDEAKLLAEIRDLLAANNNPAAAPLAGQPPQYG
ncbi:large conductance mechanosensitive channel protein MscL [Frankia sp. Mgl5]|uniref:large conductance mechanosensitive channel protein MscL n=1 Tax=Frankia sp. Mgl5 TaxID=2933793 RepID=UPI00200CD6E1|nr:large conductance mechanosensitive channel protein MscL [Frankia sp. Mgl5]MCK9932095.1 large conductance mechanosensitive channel protein MscL [Frankia sp. Mgl5]